MTVPADLFPERILNWIGGRQQPSLSGEWFEKLNPADGRSLCRVAQSGRADIDQAVSDGKKAQAQWSSLPAVRRGMMLHAVVTGLKAQRARVAQIVALETGKSCRLRWEKPTVRSS